MTNRDGEVNYSTFSNEELREAHDGINRAKYPVNFKNLLDEMAERDISANESSDDRQPNFSTPGARIRGFVALAVFCSLLCVSLYGSFKFPDSPIEPCKVDQYCGKQGQLHTADEFKAYRRWEMTMFLLWPGGVITIVLLALMHKRSA